MGIPEETRRESYIQRPVTRAEKILDFMGERELTARQIARGMGFSDPNAVRPRLTELKSEGRVKAVGKAKNDLTGRIESIWRVVL